MDGQPDGGKEKSVSLSQTIEDRLRHPVFALCCFGLGIAGLFSDMDKQYRYVIAAIAILLVVWCLIPPSRQKNIAKGSRTVFEGLLFWTVIGLAFLFALVTPIMLVDALSKLTTGRPFSYWSPHEGIGILIDIAFWWLVYKIYTYQRQAKSNPSTPTT